MRFGDFTLKSGGQSPYFVDFGQIVEAEHLQAIGRLFAKKAIDAFGVDGFDGIFGPAYKGISLATVTAVSLYQDFDKSCFAFF